MTEPSAPGTGRPRLLFLTGHSPAPPVSGGRRRELELLRRLGRTFALEVVAVSKTYAEDAQAAVQLRRHARDVAVFPAAGDPPGPLPTGAPGLASVLTRSRESQVATAAVARMLDERGYDLVHVEGYHLLQHLPAALDCPLVLGTQNVEHALWQQRATHASGADRGALLAEAERTRGEEVAAWRRADLCVTVTAEDAAVVQAYAPSTRVVVVPGGIDHEPAPDEADRQGAKDLREAYGGAPLLVFAANFGYAPNVEAAAYLCAEVLPKVRAALPDTVVLLPGNAPPERVLRYAEPRVVVPGRVPSLRAYLLAADLVVVPLLSGGGVKMKVLEALRLGRPVVTTPIGAQGLLPQAAAALVIATDAEGLAEELVVLWRDPARRASMARAALRVAETWPTWDDAAAELVRAYEAVLGAGGRRRLGSPDTRAATTEEIRWA